MRCRPCEGVVSCGQRLAAALVAGFLLAAIPAGAADAHRNLLKNPGFTNGSDDGWSIYKPHHKVVNDIGHSDQSSLYTNIVPGTPSNCSAQHIRVTGGKRYLFSVWVKTKNLTSKPRFIMSLGTRGGYGGEYGVNHWPVALEGTHDWQQIVWATPPIREDAISVSLLAIAGMGEMWWDDFQLLELDAPALHIEYPDPIWHGTKIVSADQSPYVKMKVTKTDDLPIPVKNVRIRARLFDVADNSPPYAEAESDRWKDGSLELSIPASATPLGVTTLRIEALDADSGWPVFCEAVDIDKSEWVRLDLIGPSPMGVVGTDAGQSLQLDCSVTVQPPLGSPKEDYTLKMSLVSLRDEPIDKPIVVQPVAGGQTVQATFPMDAAPMGTCYLQAAIFRSGTQERLAVSKRLVTRVNPAERPASATEILPNRLLKIDGKPFFPIGVYTLSSLDAASTQRLGDVPNPAYYEPVLDLIGRSPLNCVLDYAGGYIRPVRDVPALKGFLDKAQEKGVKVIFSVKDFPLVAIEKGEATLDNPDLLGNTLEVFKGHPAVFAVYIGDENCGPKHWPPSEAIAARARQIDPWHPSFSVQFNTPASRGYARASDIYSTDPYFILCDQAMSAKSWRTARQAMPDGQPLWAVVQAFGPGYENGNPADTKEPSYDDMRCGSFCAVAEGATGIIYYSLHSMQRSPKFAERWSDLCKVAAEIQGLVPIIGLPQPAQPVEAVAGNVSLGSREDHGKLYAFVVNHQRREQKVSLKWPKSPARVRDKLSGVEISVTGDQTTFDMPPQAVLVLETD